jgi:autotransporter-associated beta strand protein
MKTISVKRHIAAFGAMLVATIGGTAFAAPTNGVDAKGVYYVDVPRGETATLDSSMFDVSAANTAGAPFAKRGEGMLRVGDAMSAFAGEIRVEDGTYDVLNDNGLGTVAGFTSVSNGATLKISGGNFGNAATHQNEAFYVDGAGYAGQGAINVYQNKSRISFLNLLGDTLISGKSLSLNEWSGGVAINGKTLTVKLENAVYTVSLSYGRITSMGDIVVESGSIQFDQMRSITMDGSEWTLTVKSGGSIWAYGNYQYNNNGLELPWRLVLEDGAGINIGNGTIVWAGPTTVSGAASVVRQEDEWGMWFKGVTLDGIVSGGGSLDVKRGQFLGLTNPANDFTGSIVLNGVNDATNSTLNLSNNSLPVNSSGVTMNYGTVELKGSVGLSGVASDNFVLPKLTCTSQGSVVCNEAMIGSMNKQHVKELVKSGDGVLTLTGPLCVTGRTEVAAGTLRLGSRPPARQTGLECYFFDQFHSPYYAPSVNGGNNGPWIGVSNIDEPPFTRIAGAYDGSHWDNTRVELEYMGVDTNGVSLAYKAWPVKIMDVIYRGFLWVDGDVPVTWNFAANVHNYLRLRIDGNDVIKNVDAERAGIGDRFTTSAPVTLAPGAHSFCLYMATYGNAAKYGPAWYTKEGPGAVNYWGTNMGVAYKPTSQGTVISSNSTDYVKFTASQFSPSIDRDKVSLDSSRYRASFEGGVRFAVGTVLDIGDIAPYTPMPLASLEGAMTVTNGTLVLSGNWTIDAAEINAGGLVLAGDANLVFADGATLTVANASQIRHKGTVGMPLVKCAGTCTVTGRPTIVMEEDGWKLDETNGNLNIHRPIGFMVIVQ